jgi:hypothetical protein
VLFQVDFDRQAEIFSVPDDDEDFFPDDVIDDT